MFLAEQRLRQLRRSLGEAEGTTPADEFAKKIEDTIQKNFPKSVVRAKYSAGIAKSITVWFALGDKSRQANNIIANDPAYHIFHVWFPKDYEGGELPDSLAIELSRGGALTVKPEPGSYLAYDSVKFGWRKKAGSPDQLVKHLDNYFKKVKKVLQANKDKLPDSFNSKGLV